MLAVALVDEASTLVFVVLAFGAHVRDDGGLEGARRGLLQSPASNVRWPRLALMAAVWLGRCSSSNDLPLALLVRMK